MWRDLPVPHRLARINYAPRMVSFGYSLLVLEALAAERAYSLWVMLAAIVTFLAYPHLAYLHARIAVNSKRAEMRNLHLDSFLLGAWVTQMEFALWPSGSLIIATCLNNTACGGPKLLLRGLVALALGALGWASLAGFRLNPDTGALVSAVSLVGLLAYASWVGYIMHSQNQRLMRTRDALRKSEEQFRFIAEHAGDLLAVVDARGRLRFASESHLNYFEPRQVEPGADWFALVAPEDRELARNRFQTMVFSGNGERVHLRMTVRGGDTRLIDCEGNPVRDRGGDSEMIIVLSHDITHRSRAEIDLALAAHAFDSLADGVLISDNTGRIEFVNRSYTALTGYEPRDVLGRTTNDLKIGLQSQYLFNDIWNSIERNGNWRGQAMERCKDGSLAAVSASVSAVKKKDGPATHYVWVVNANARGSEARVAWSASDSQEWQSR
ncbi:MAG: PAS domain S-box protein [Betaproteobacteria bacterium]|nr:PAS domain S-box protein [Betaproteobacteria bacterium]